MRLKYLFIVSIAVSTATMLTGCVAHLHPNAFVPDAEALKKRAMQTQRIRSVKKQQLMSAIVGVVQDLGFNLDETDSDLGVFVASKSRTAVDSKQVASAIFQGLFSNNNQIVIDKHQRFRISVIAYPVSNQRKRNSSGDYLVRANFQRIVWNNLNKVSRAESLNDPEFFKDFFARLSKSLFLDKADL